MWTKHTASRFVSAHAHLQSGLTMSVPNLHCKVHGQESIIRAAAYDNRCTRLVAPEQYSPAAQGAIPPVQSMEGLGERSAEGDAPCKIRSRTELQRAERGGMRNDRFVSQEKRAMSVVLVHQKENQMDAGIVGKLRTAVGARELLVTTDSEQIRERLEEIEVLAGHAPIEVLLRAENCRWVQLFSAGADALLMRHPQTRDMAFQLTNVSGIHAISITEHIFALMLTLARNIQGAIRRQKEGDWRRLPHTAVQEVAGSTMCLLGVGSIGSRVALTARAFDIRVVAVRRHMNLALPQGVEAVYGPDQMEKPLAQADWTVSCLPHTPDTHELIGAAAFGAMSSDAHFINIGRGKVVDELALIAALQAGGIKGAGLDVTHEEPNPQDSPLWQMDNVIITSHYSGLSVEYGRRAGEIFLDNLRRYDAGRPLRNQVDKRLGY